MYWACPQGQPGTMAGLQSFFCFRWILKHIVKIQTGAETDDTVAGDSLVFGLLFLRDLRVTWW